ICTDPRPSGSTISCLERLRSLPCCFPIWRYSAVSAFGCCANMFPRAKLRRRLRPPPAFLEGAALTMGVRCNYHDRESGGKRPTPNQMAEDVRGRDPGFSSFRTFDEHNNLSDRYGEDLRTRG